MFVSFLKTHFGYDDGFSIYEMKMNGLGERKLLRDNLKGPKISMCYDRDSKTLFISDQHAGYILSYSTKGLHSVLINL